jgi:hydroxymethylpyrimidine/phosphomethylpyrimidine kinase
MASGLEIPQAVENSENYIRKVLEFCMRVGGGRRIVNPLVPLHNEAERSRVREDVKSSLKLLMENRGFLPYLADVGTQIAMSLPFPSSTEHVAAVARRIRMEGGKFKAGDVRFGVSSHMANLVLACHALDDRIRAALNLHYNPALVEMLRKSGLAVSSFDRKYEPRRVKQTEGETLRWGVKHASVKRGRVPDVIYDLGEEGKEPMIRIVGRSAMDVVRKAGQAVKMLDAHRRQR